MPNTIHIRGEIDASNSPPLRAELYAALDAHPGSVLTLDLARLEFIDSMGLGVLVGALKKARLDGGDVIVTALAGRMAKVFAVIGLDKVFKVGALGVSTRPRATQSAQPGHVVLRGAAEVRTGKRSS